MRASLEVDYSHRDAATRNRHGRTTTSHFRGVVARPEKKASPIQHRQEVLPVPDVVSGGDYVGAVVLKLAHDILCETESSGSILTVDHAKIDIPFAN